jgi:hypothetical protein
MALKNYNDNSIALGDYISLKITYMNNTTTSMWDMDGWSVTGNNWENIITGVSNITQVVISTLDTTLAYHVNGWAFAPPGIDGNTIGNLTTPGTANPSQGSSNDGGTTSVVESYLLDPSSGYAPALVGSTTIYVRLTFDTTVSPDLIVNKRDIINVNDIVICFRGDSLISVLNKETNEEHVVLAKDVVKGDIVKSTTRGWVPVLANLITGLETNFFLFKKDIFAANVPNEDFYATGGHPILIDGKEIRAMDVPEAIKIKIESAEKVYSIMTEKREFIKINNMDICTWEPIEWAQFVEKYKLFYISK